MYVCVKKASVLPLCFGGSILQIGAKVQKALDWDKFYVLFSIVSEKINTNVSYIFLLKIRFLNVGAAVRIAR